MEFAEQPQRKSTRGARWHAGIAACLVASSLGVAASEPALREEPFAPRSGPRGATLFSEMAAERTGVVTDNAYSDPKMWGERYQEFALGAMGTGLAAGDYDGDGRVDLFAVSKTGMSRLFRNLGGWKFEDVTAKAGLAPGEGGLLEKGLSWFKSATGTEGDSVEVWRQGASFADVNNDGWLDLYVCRFNAPNLLYINKGDGTFAEEAAARGLAVVDASGMGAFCDYDADGWLDVYVQTNMLDAARRPNGQPGLLFRNNGDGTFADVTARSGISGDTLTHSATWWDYDADGRPDLYVANDFGGADQLFRNNGDGTFTDVINQAVPRTAYSSMGADVGDVNNDGLIDFLVADMAATTHEKDQRGMASSRELTREDANLAGVAPQFPVNALYLGTGTAVTQEAARLAGLGATDWTWSVLFEDLDDDGRLDLHVTNGMNREYQNSDLRQRIVTAESLETRMRIMRESPELLENNLAYRNLGNLRFEETGAAWGLAQNGISFGAVFADFDGDGDRDLAFSNYEKSVTMLRNDNDSGHRVVVALRGQKSNRFGVGATVKIESASGVQVRQLVLGRGYLSTSEPMLHFGLGADTSIDRLTVTWPDGGTQSFDNVPVDRRLTITESATPAGATARRDSREAQFSNVSDVFGFSLQVREGIEHEPGLHGLQPVGFNRRGPGLAVGDMNGDGRDDILLGGTNTDPARLLLGGSAGFTVASALPGATVDDGPVLVFDADGDGANDLLLSGAGASMPAGAADYQPRLFLNAAGTLSPAVSALPAVPVSAGAAAVADFDRDGRLDVFIGGRVEPGRYPLAPQSALLANRGGRFEDVAGDALRRVGMVTSALWSDVDLDGWPDLIVALEWGSVKCFRNEEGRGFADSSERLGFAAAGNGWWTSLATADFNNDGLPDFAAGNVGLNTQYRASVGEPALIYFGAFSPGGAPRLIEAHHEGGRTYPWRTRKALGAAVPSILQRFQKNDLFAKATLDEILGKERLATARRFAATEFQSGAFLSQPDGTYRFSALPRIAQISPTQGLAAGDFDGDSHADLFAVHNSHAPSPVVGRFDGGLGQLLRGDGRGGFSAVAPAASGLVVTGDAKALAVIDLDANGWPDFLVTRNDSTTLAWRNGGGPGRRSIAVRLKGPASNPSGIGARVTMELSDGSTRSAEIDAGGGYYSQSAPVAFFGSPASNPARRVHVRWPDGSTSESDVPADSNTITVSR